MDSPGLFHLFHDVSVLLDGGDVDQTERRVVQPQDHADDRVQSDLEALRRSADRDELLGLDLQHLVGGGRIDRDFVGIGHHARLPAGSAEIRGIGVDFVRGGGDVFGAATAIVHSAGGHDQQNGAGRHVDLGHSDLSDVADPVLRVVVDGVLPVGADGVTRQRNGSRLNTLSAEELQCGLFGLAH